MSICTALLEQVQRIAKEHNASRIEKIVLQIGPLSGIETSLLTHAYPLAAAGTVAENAELVIESSPIRVKCTRCGAVTEAMLNRLVCRECGDFRTQLISGDEMILSQLEITISSPE